jgi:S1-C subfamily serine protease
VAPIIRRVLPALAGALLLVPGPAPARTHGSLTVQEALLRAKPAVMLVVAEVTSQVTLNCGSGATTVTPYPFRETGTGWVIDGRGWLVTNGHVVQPAHEPPRWLVNQQAQRAVTTACLPKALAQAGLTPGERPDAEDAIRRRLMDRVLPTARVKMSPEVFVVLSSGVRLKAEVKKFSPPVSNVPGTMSGQDLALLKIPGRGYPTLPLANSREAKIGDPVHILGFPGVVLSHELLNQSSSLEASVTNGAVSAFRQDRDNQPVIQTDAPAAWGNSGGPAVDQAGAVLGVLTFVSLAPGAEGSIVQGFNFIIPSELVRRFLADTEVEVNRESAFNEKWYAGLRELFTEDWAGAVRRFEEADAILPNLPDVKRMLADAREKVKNPPPRPFPWFWVALGVTLVSASGFGTQFLLRWHRNRYRVHPSEVVRMLEAGKSPVIIDARKSDAYEALPMKIPGSVRLAMEELESGISGLELDTTRPAVAYCT